jgi:hypothetical protein
MFQLLGRERGITAMGDKSPKDKEKKKPKADKKAAPASSPAKK